MAREYADLDDLISSRLVSAVDDSRFDVTKALDKLGIEYRAERNELIARCPHHAPDVKPSWSIAAEGDKRGFHSCFSCGFGGRLWELVARVLGYPHAEDASKRALAWLEDHVGADAPDEMWRTHAVDLITSARREFTYPPGVIEARLDDWVPVARAYALGRGLTPWQIGAWKIAYAVEGPQAGRIILPVHDGAGRLANYTGRDFTGAPVPRYKNASKRESPDAKVLFGESWWPSLDRRGRVYLGEGALKCLAVERAVNPDVSLAAVYGNRLLKEHVAALSTFREIFVLHDPNPAGDALLEQVREALGRHVGVADVRFDPKTDADSVSPEVLRARIEAAE